MGRSNTVAQEHDGCKARIARKRRLCCIGGLTAVMTSTTAAAVRFVSVQASPFFQLHVPSAHRLVAYQHLVEGRPREMPSRFWFPPEGSSVEEEAPRLEVSRASPSHVLLSVVADAAKQHPHGVPRRQRRVRSRATNPGKYYTKGDIGANDGAIKAKESHRRRDQISDKFVEGSGAALLQDGDGRGQHVAAEVSFSESTAADLDADNNTDVYVGTTSSVTTTSSPYAANRTYNSEPIYQPLRIRAVLSEQQDGGEFLNAAGREVLLMDIIRPALLTWSGALRVEPVLGNLTIDQHQLFDNQTCGPGLGSGLPSPGVPSYHFTDGVPETDMILYLSLAFTSGGRNQTHYVNNGTGSISNRINVTGNKTDPITAFNARMNETNSTLGATLGGAIRKSGLENLPDADVWRAARAELTNPSTGGPASLPRERDNAFPTPMLCNGEDYVAVASYCNTCQYDRPTAGMLHICIDDTFFNKETRNDRIAAVMHELGHALGFNSRSMAHFRRSDGTPMTARDRNGNIPDTTVECTGPRSGRKHARLPLPSEDILKFRVVRGGVRVAEVVTPSVLQVVRNHFDCQKLTGAELESGELSRLAWDKEEQACIGDHWERRLFRSDLLNPVIDTVEYSPFISTITLAYFADSGWYQVDLSMAQLPASWGRGAGCSFVEDRCIRSDGAVPKSNTPFFCNTVPQRTTNGHAAEIDGCTTDLSRKATCSMGEYDWEIPPEYQYFGLTLGRSVGGSDPFIDYCPTFAGFANGLCSSFENAELLRVDKVERFGTRNSRCLSATANGAPTAVCLPIACVVEDRTLHIKLAGRWRRCKTRDHVLKARKKRVQVNCPDARRVCPTFYCVHDCLGTSGRCDYDTGGCVCSGGCGYEQNTEPFSTRTRKNRTLTEMPDADSPLSDYYVPYKKSLQDDAVQLLTIWQLVVLIICIVFIVSIALWYFRLKDAASREETHWNSGDNLGGPVNSNPNKDKMIAAVLVDMRMNANDSASVAPTADTASSLCGIERAASTDFRKQHSCRDRGVRCSLASEGVPSETEAHDVKTESDAKTNSCVRKRRFRVR